MNESRAGQLEYANTALDMWNAKLRETEDTPENAGKIATCRRQVAVCEDYISELSLSGAAGETE